MEVRPRKRSREGEFVRIKAHMRLPLAPVWLANEHGSGGPLDGAREVLAGWLMRYIPSLKAVLLSFDPDIKLVSPTMSLSACDSPYPSTPSSHTADPAALLRSSDDAVADGEEADDKQVKLMTVPLVQSSGFMQANIAFSALAWQPLVGQRIVGTPTTAQPGVLALLVHNLFTATITADHIPSDEYYFDADAPVPSAVVKRRSAAFVSGTAAADEASKAEDEDDVTERGWWVHRGTREALGSQGQAQGGADDPAAPLISFTVVSVTVSNSMIYVGGSLLADPFAVPAPKPASSVELAAAAGLHAAPLAHQMQEEKKKAETPAPEGGPELRDVSQPREVAGDDASTDASSDDDALPPGRLPQQKTGGNESDDETEQVERTGGAVATLTDPPKVLPTGRTSSFAAGAEKDEKDKKQKKDKKPKKPKLIDDKKPKVEDKKPKLDDGALEKKRKTDDDGSGKKQKKKRRKDA